MPEKSEEAGATDETRHQAKLRSIATYVVASAWALGGLYGLIARTGGFRFLSVLGVLLALALLRWPTVLRWPMAAFSGGAPLIMLATMHWYFHTLPHYPLMISAGLGIVGHVLLLFGTMSVARVSLGIAAFLPYWFGFPDPRTEAPISPEACEERVDSLSARIKDYNADPSAHIRLRAAKLPTMRKGARATAQYDVMEVTATGKWFGEPLSNDPAKAAYELRTRLEDLRRGNRTRREPHTFYLAADATQRVADIAPLITHLDRARVLLLAKGEDGPLGTPPASAESLAHQLDNAADESELATILANELGRRAGPCAPLAKRLVQLNETPSNKRPAFFATALDEGLRECSCSWVDIDALEYVAMRLLSAPKLDHFAVPVPHDDAGQLVLPSDLGLTVEQWMQQL